jgi:hypothetical protein
MHGCKGCFLKCCHGIHPLVLAVFVLALTPHASAFPLLFKAAEAPGLLHSPRENLVAFSTPDNGKSWQRIPVQTDEVEDDVFLILRSPNVVFPIRQQVNHPPAKDPAQGMLMPYHRITLNEKHFGSCDANCFSMGNLKSAKICAGATPLPSELHSITAAHSGERAFLGVCDTKPNTLKNAQIEFEAKTQIVRTTEYSLKLSQDTPFLMDWLKLAGAQKSAIENTELQAKLKTRMLVTVNINSEDLKGKLASVTNNSVGTSLEVATTDKVMGIKLVEQVCCDLSFFEDAFYFPVLVNIPGALGKLRNGSDVNFSFLASSGEPPVYSSSEPPSLIIKQNEKYVGVAFRPLKRDTKTNAEVFGEKELRKRDLTKQNNGMSISLGGAEGEQRFEAWFYTGTNLDTLKNVVRNGVRYAIQPAALR